MTKLRCSAIATPSVNIIEKVVLCPMTGFARLGQVPYDRGCVKPKTSQVTTNLIFYRPYCTLCEYAIGEVDKMITDKKNTDEIKNVLDRICYELSNPIRDECVKMVNQYTDEIVQMFVAEYTPQEVCSELGLCDPPQADEINDNTILQFEEEVPEENDVSEKPLCALCEFAMDILEKQILTNRTMDMAEHAIEMLCSYMPETIADKCIDFVQEYGDEIVDLIIKAEMNPDQVCAAITLCTSPYTTFGNNSF